MVKNLARSWKTTLAGCLTALVAWANAVIAVTDGVAATKPDWALAVTASIAAVGLLMAKDGNK